MTECESREAWGWLLRGDVIKGQSARQMKIRAVALFYL
jgi:hypothetical protein